MPISSCPPQNALLASLPDDVMERLSPKLQRVQMSAGSVLFEPGVPMRGVYFLESAVVAMSFVLENGGSAEVALIGREGLVGVRLLLGESTLNVRASVQSAGSGLRLPAQSLLEEVGRGGALMHVLLQYTASYIGQIVQTAACNRHGTVEQRLCRWLLLSLDRVPSTELTMTHEVIADALGVKREGITEAAGRLRRLGAIRYQRGHIEVLDRALLESRTGEFYQHDNGGPARRAVGSN
ncbi:MAG: Crp/Fnr family transcriptional regulator [Rubrivivax sp.]|nr:Crp/Fnr family transcriptional regulator [Rubrivivax sp.]MBK7262394.1 Crp/Fnr family transcriptional regulator [Rubrivivax sp.]MBK8528617.1 Crp/Fnr family transcriptional regulator [Rubrivivax sp.]